MREFVVDEGVDDAVVDALVVAADDEKVRIGGESRASRPA